MNKNDLIVKILQLKSQLGISWSKLGVLVGRTKYIDTNHIESSWSIDLIRRSIAKLEGLKAVQESLNSGSKCANVLSKDTANNAKEVLINKGLESYIDEIDGKFLVSWE